MEPPPNPADGPFLDLEPLRVLRGKARGASVTVRSPGDAVPVSRFDPRQSEQLSTAQSQGVKAFHETCAAQLAGALEALLHAPCELSLGLVEQIPCAQYLESLPQPAYLAAISSAVDARALMQIDLPLLLPMLDLLLGGSGKDALDPRDVSEIEEEILDPVGRTVCRELDVAWRPLLKMDFVWCGRLPAARAEEFLAPGDRALVLSFDVRVQEMQGKLQLAFPSVLWTALLRKLTPQEPLPKPRAPQEGSRLREHLLEGRYEAELRLPVSRVSIRQLHQLQPGDVLVLKVGPQETLEVLVAGQSMFLAAPVRRGSQRGAQVQKVLSIVPREEREEKK